jgi:UDP-N-acetylmuramate dehydrogenase
MDCINNTPQTINATLPPIAIQEYVPLADKNTFNTGGSARFYCRPENYAQFAQALTFAQEKNIELFVLGKGANILISDQGFPGLVIHPHLSEITLIETLNDPHGTVYVKAGAGVSIERIITWCFEHNIIGLEEFSGIPGTIGGAVYINLHYYEYALSDFLIQATLMHHTTKEIITVDTAWLNFGYDQSKLQDKEYFVLDATFKLRQADQLTTAFAQGRSAEIIRHRHKRYPYQYTCGSFFRNFHPEEVAHTDKKLIYVAYYLDQVGVKGQLKIGGAGVSHQHANMIVCQNGMSHDIIQVAQTMQKLVFEKFNILPQPECQLIGFPNNPFMP